MGGNLKHTGCGLKRKKSSIRPEDIFARYRGNRISGILRIYAATNPGKRSVKCKLHIISPYKDLGLRVEQIEAKARKMYHIT